MLFKTQHSSKSRLRLLAAFAVGVVIGLWLFHTPTAEAPHKVEEATESLAAAASAPTKLRIPDARVDTSFAVPLGVMESGEIEVPEGYDEVAYYKHGPIPGELGPAVVLGHVDSVDGPGVFYSLGQLEKGDEIFIDREDGSTLVFAVDALERHLQAGFPTEKVYGNLSYAGLRLITCSGIFSHGAQRYSHNLIVFARLKEIR